MQVIKNKRAVFFNDGATNMVAPGIATVIAAARQ
jgi:hypothetical protein